MNGDADGTDSEPAAMARKEVIDAFGRSAEVYGLSQSYGRLYGILFFADEPMSLDDIVTESGYAKSTVSTAMQSLDRLHLVERRSIPGEGKKVFYEAERDFWRIVQELLKNQVKHEIDIMSRSLESAAERLEQSEADGAAEDLEKIRELQQTYERTERLVDVFTQSSISRLVTLVDRFKRSE